LPRTKYPVSLIFLVSCFEVARVLSEWIGGRGVRERTIPLDLASLVFKHETELWPFGKVFEVEVYAVGFGQVVEVALVELEKVHRTHWAEG